MLATPPRAAGPGAGAGAALALALAALAALAAVRLLRLLLDMRRVARGLAGVPLAPTGGRWLLPHARALLAGTPWDVMEAWVAPTPRKLVQACIGHRRMVLVGSAAGARDVFQSRARAFAKDTDFSFKPFLPILGTGLVTAAGPLWQAQRLLIAPALRVDVLDAVPPIAAAAAARLIAKLDAATVDGPAVVDMEEEFRLLTLQVIGAAVLSLPPDECDRVFPELYLPVMEEANLRALRPWRAFVPGKARRAYAAGIKALDAYIRALLRARWAAFQKAKGAKDDPGCPRAALADGSGDILGTMLAAIDAKGEPWSAALETQLCYEVKTFVLAGHETSAAMLTWSLYELAAAPALAAKVRGEAGRVLGSGPHPATPSRQAAEDGLDYTLACLKESLRKYSVVPVVTRVATSDTAIDGVPIPRGAYVGVVTQAVHNAWPRAGEWDPARFLPGGEYDPTAPGDALFRFLAFIQGPRNCLGQYFALLEARIVLAAVVDRFDFSKATPGVPRRHPTVIPTGPEGGMPMVVARRPSSRPRARC
jgi:cytochrome P450